MAERLLVAMSGGVDSTVAVRLLLDAGYSVAGAMPLSTALAADWEATTGGLIVDTECRVLDKDRQPIEGLFAAGIVSGGMFYNTYPHHLNCLSHTRNCLMGYTIGQVLGAKQ